MTDFPSFYKTILGRKLFFLPIVFFSLLGYSFSIYNRTVGIDDFTRDINLGSGNRMLSGRWGMILWNKLVGTTVALDPFIDRFLALVFLIIAAILLCYILYIIGGKKRIISYTIAASTFITYPLINSIWEYTGADFMLTGNLCLVTLAAITVKLQPFGGRYTLLAASLLLLLPMSSYESAIFYYITLGCIIIFYEYYIRGINNLYFIEWGKDIVSFFAPIVIAFIARFVVSFIVNVIFDLQYSSGGSTAIAWLNDSPFQVMKCMLVFNFVKYVLTGLVYFPITIFVAFILVFLGHLGRCNRKSIIFILSGAFILISLFSQSFLQGMELEYRNAQTISLFVSFSSFLLCTSVVNEKRRKLIYIILFALCWHQAVCLNRILGLNNLRSDNEVALIHQIGTRLTSEFEKKPVAFVGDHQKGDYILKQISVDEFSWNGRLFYSIYDRFIAKLNRPYRFGANVNSVLGYYQLQECFSYFGYYVDVVLPSDLAKLDVYPKKYIKIGDVILTKASNIVKEKRIKPYQIIDAGDFLVVYLGGELYT